MGQALHLARCLQQLDSDVVERAIAFIGSGVGKVARRVADFAIVQVQWHRLFPHPRVDNVRITQRDDEIVMAVAVHQRGGLGRDCHVEYADVFVLKNQVMTGL